jgi:uncharacterized membrane protein (Fun14 family)
MNQVAVDSTAAATSPFLTSVGFSGLTGFVIGFAVKKVLKVLAVGAGIFFAALMYLESQNIVNINWDKLQNASQNAVSTITDAVGQFPTTTSTNFASYDRYWCSRICYWFHESVIDSNVWFS